MHPRLPPAVAHVVSQCVQWRPFVIAFQVRIEIDVLGGPEIQWNLSRVVADLTHEFTLGTRTGFLATVLAEVSEKCRIVRRGKIRKQITVKPGIEREHIILAQVDSVQRLDQRINFIRRKRDRQPTFHGTVIEVVLEWIHAGFPHVFVGSRVILGIEQNWRITLAVGGVEVKGPPVAAFPKQRTAGKSVSFDPCDDQ